VSARDCAVAVLVALGVAGELVCCLGVLAMRSAIDRLHYASAATAVGPALVAAAVCVREGVVSSQALNSLLVALLLAVAGGALAAGTARVVRLRDGAGLESKRDEREHGR
jgi:multisubunit Na+/H+ antiporter MnhG subunit